ncbi:hypothetical protein NKH77_27750 [Streptomyces sp. M19]
MAVDGKSGTLYVGSDASPDDQRFVGNTIVGFDLRTGKKTGETEVEQNVVLVPIGFDRDGAVLALQTATTAEGGGVWRVDQKTHAMSKLLTLPTATRDTEETFAQYGRLDGQAQYTKGRLYLGAVDISDEPDAEEALAAVYGQGE